MSRYERGHKGEGWCRMSMTNGKDKRQDSIVEKGVGTPVTSQTLQYAFKTMWYCSLSITFILIIIFIYIYDFIIYI